MDGGFSFDDVDIAMLGLEYAPDNANTYVYQPAQYQIHEQKFGGHNGGYYYGLTSNAKDFRLRCIYQDSRIDEGIMTNIHALFRRGKTARLVFKNRPWCWYTATVVSVDTSQMMNYMNGVVTITLRAYYPYARCDDFYVPEDSIYKESMLNNSAMILGPEKNGFDYIYEFNNTEEPMMGMVDINLYNPGTENASLGIEIAGEVGASGVMIYNETTGQRCKIVALTNALTTDVQKYLAIDGISGKTLLTNGISDTEYGYLYHDYGFIDLAPALVQPNLHVTGASGSQRVLKDDTVDPYKYADKYLLLKDIGFCTEIRRDITKEQHTLYLKDPLPQDYDGEATVVQPNHLHVYPVGEIMQLTHLKLSWLPTFA